MLGIIVIIALCLLSPAFARGANNAIGIMILSILAGMVSGMFFGEDTGYIVFDTLFFGVYGGIIFLALLWHSLTEW